MTMKISKMRKIWRDQQVWWDAHHKSVTIEIPRRDYGCDYYEWKTPGNTWNNLGAYGRRMKIKEGQEMTNLLKGFMAGVGCLMLFAGGMSIYEGNIQAQQEAVTNAAFNNSALY